MNLVWIKWGLFGLLLFPLAYILFKKFSEFSWIVILLATFTYLLLFGLKIKKEKVKILLFNISAIFFALFICESYFSIKNMSLKNGNTIKVLGNYIKPHPYLGYGPKKFDVYNVKSIINTDTIYNVSYTISDGLRYTPNSNEESLDCVLFFGCSFTFGEGLSDSSTIPFFFNQYANQHYKVFNYGFRGYGPHQMLANIENRVPKDIQVFKNKKIAIFTFFYDHIPRAAGYRIIDPKEPRYEIVDGSLRKVGTLSKLPRWMSSMLWQSHTYRKLFIRKNTSHYDLMRTIEIIKKAKDILLKNNVILYIVVLDELEKNDDDIYFLNEMKRNNIKTFLVSNAIPDYFEKRDNYILHLLDRHTNGLANEKIAKYLYLQLRNY